MHEYKPHTFDTRGFFVGSMCLVLMVALIGIARYGFVFAESGGIPEAETATAALSSSTITEKGATPVPLPLSEVSLPKLSADSYLIADITNDTVLASKDSETPYPIASISKLLVALVARENIAATSTIRVTEDDRRAAAVTPGSIARTESFAASDLYYPLLMESNNSVAYAFARTFGTEEFIRRMLRKAHEIGMDATLLNDSSGLSENNTASARDLLTLVRYIESHMPDLFEITRTKSKKITAESGRTYTVGNLNHYAGRPGFIGGKTGYTDEARETFVSLFDVHHNGATTTLAIVILHSDDRRSDTDKLLTWFRESTR